ncbi:MAG TPA: hypothetical protein VEK79_09325 [Thermoanaerobaculia bacterium]|nr:hypothetical protein [Thermoanaerobaculia bacterium]
MTRPRSRGETCARYSSMTKIAPRAARPCPRGMVKSWSAITSTISTATNE